MSQTIGDLPVGRSKSIYQRTDGNFWLKLNKQHHVMVLAKKQGKKLHWIGAGKAEAFDPTEQVVVIQLGAND